VPAMIGYWSRELRCEFANKAYREWFGRSPEQIVGMPMLEFMGAEMFALNEPHVALTLAGQTQRFERCHVRPGGTVSITDVRYVPDLSETGEVRGFYALTTDVTALRQALVDLEAAHARLLQESALDYLTGLSNRRVFSEHSEAAAHEFAASGLPYGLILMDLDDFKHINDDFGHDVGDEVLRALGRILKEQLRNCKDIAARLGGEEFAVLCFGDLDQAALCRLAERIRVQISREGVHSPRGIVHFTGSFGAALSCPEDVGWRNIYARADAALYEAKANGKNRIVFGPASGHSSTGPRRALKRDSLQGGG
jgi:diguanylate cyclase (GGDEF)-like protein/PAS domain S-box-containing protein